MSRTAGVRWDRRKVLCAAIALVSGATVSTGNPLAVLAASDLSRQFFSPARFDLLSAIADTLIPRTDTPGAADVGVPGFIDALMRNWAAASTAVEINKALDIIDAGARANHAGKGFAELPPAQRTTWLSTRTHGDGWRRLRYLIIMGYYWSEPGATVELRYELDPGAWEPAIPVTASTRAWAD